MKTPWCARRSSSSTTKAPTKDWGDTLPVVWPPSAALEGGAQSWREAPAHGRDGVERSGTEPTGRVPPILRQPHLDIGMFSQPYYIFLPESIRFWQKFGKFTENYF